MFIISSNFNMANVGYSNVLGQCREQNKQGLRILFCSTLNF